MMDVEFFIPLKKEDLLTEEKSQYYVQNVQEFSDCLELLDDIKTSVHERGCEAILDHFDTIFSMLDDMEELSFLHLQDLFDQVVSKILKHAVSFAKMLLSEDPVQPSTQNLNTLKMTFYIYFLHLKTYEDKVAFKNNNLMTDAKGRGGGKSKLKGNDLWDWNFKKKSSLIDIYEFLQLNISQLWQPPVVEEQFVNLIGNCCYKIFENPEIVLVKNKPLRDSASQVLCILIQNFGYGLMFITKLVQLLKQMEHSAEVLAWTVITAAKEYNCSSLVGKVVRELCESVQDEEIPALAKGASTIISEIADMDPGLLQPSTHSLLKFLVSDAYTLRIAILVAFTEMILKCFSKENCSEADKKTRDRLLRALLDHTRDQNTYVRSKVMRLWCKLAVDHAIPNDKFLPALEAAKHHITDKSSFVSKNSIAFFREALSSNPYAGRFNMGELKAKLKKEEDLLFSLAEQQPVDRNVLWQSFEDELAAALSNVMNEDWENGIQMQLPLDKDNVDIPTLMDGISTFLASKCFSEAFILLKKSEGMYPDSEEIRCSNLDTTDEVFYYLTVLKKVFLNSEEAQPEETQLEPSRREFEVQKSVVKYCQDSIAFAKCIEEATDLVQAIVLSKSGAEAVEGIEFITVAYQFGVTSAQKAVKDMVLLVQSQTPGVKDAVANAYKTLYLNSNKQTPMARALQVSNRLIKLLQDFTIERKCYLEDIIQIWNQNKELEKEVILVLWDKYFKKIAETTDVESDFALILLEMIANIDTSFVLANLSLVTNDLLPAAKSVIKVQYCARMVSKVGTIKKDGKYMRYAPNNPMFGTFVQLLADYFLNVKGISTQQFANMAIDVINMIFEVSLYPDELVIPLLEDLYRHVTKDCNNSEDLVIEEELLIRLLIVYSHIMFRLWHYFDRDVFNNIKNCKDGVVTEAAEMEDEFEADNVVAADDALYEVINEMCDMKLLQEGFLMGHIKDLILKVVKLPEGKVSPVLKSAAASSLAKLMLISQTMCDCNIQLYVTLMDRCSVETVRGNLVLGFGDLTCRFPNTIEPWTPYLYARLKDTSVSVRGKAVTVLTYLITREMVKVRGQIAELALCLHDPEPSISEKVKYLLADLSQKGNTLYNVIPDIVSSLSNPERANPVSKDIFEGTVRHLLKLVTKERQNESLVEKFISRLREASTETETVCERLAFCLSQLSYSEKSLRRLCEALPTFTDKLSLPCVSSALSAIMNTAHKSTKAGTKVIGEEGLEKIEELLTGKGEDDGSPVPCTPKIRKPKVPPSSRKTSTRKPTAPPSARASRARKRQVYLDSDEDE